MRSSIRKKISESFIVLLVCSFGTWWIMNSLFLQPFYSSYKSKSLKVISSNLNSFGSEGLENENNERRITKLCEDNNVDLLVIDPALNTKYSSINNPEDMQSILFKFIFSADESDNQIQKIKDTRNNSEYYVVWGYLQNGDFYIMRTAIQSMIESVNISNRFMFAVGSSIIFIGIIVSAFIAKRITKPIRELTDISDRMIHLDFNAKYTGNSEDEIGILGERMNNLSESLESTISELKTANNELQQDIRKKEEIDEMRRDFVSNVSHELKTPISLIQGYAEGLKECINDDAESREFYCDVIMDEAAKMNKLVRNLLSLSQIESGGEVITLERVDLHYLINNILESSTILIREKNIRINFNVPENMYVWADEYKIEEVITNYVSNAINHVSAENVIEISSDEYVDTEDNNKKIVRVKVFNSGAPIPVEDIDNIWIKFYKVDKARTREYGGSGIGLSIVKAIMDAHNRKCGVDNYENGVCFWFDVEKS